MWEYARNMEIDWFILITRTLDRRISFKRTHAYTPVVCICRILSWIPSESSITALLAWTICRQGSINMIHIKEHEGEEITEFNFEEMCLIC